MPLILSVFSTERRIEVHSVLQHTITLICSQLLCFASPANVSCIAHLGKEGPASTSVGVQEEGADSMERLQFSS